MSPIIGKRCKYANLKRDPVTGRTTKVYTGVGTIADAAISPEHEGDGYYIVLILNDDGTLVQRWHEGVRVDMTGGEQ